MSEPQVAPYGGLLTKTLDDEKARESKLQEQSIEVQVNNQTEVLRPEALHIRGVDSLSTEDIKAFIDYYVNYTVSEEQEQTEGQDEPTTKIVYEPFPIDEQITFRIQWINDTSVNVSFKTMEDAHNALKSISISSNPNIEVELNEEQKIQDAIQERETKPYAPIIAFRKQQNLSNRLGVAADGDKEQNPVEQDNTMDEDDTSIVLYVRQSFQSDRKVKNASAYSRYYLLHGEPERKPRRHNKYRLRESHHNHRRERKPEQDEEEDLFAHKLRQSRPANRGRDDEEDLFPGRSRSRTDSNRDRSRSPMRID
ncbi:uncharacterized protein AC631_04530 [Debaryomyces fabryi]|uniref:Uncharacterized protein n=1 Tax=Debaryomyces fabryi TaxID=58627 RepID=A0A0V1PUE1_9ASCO|nr:uncharacterized protein AC631_04530 [Debaryomyces fabryi]KRZ99721.1 hypothetical protein AC631_04530 [Debaryomyces fabryi]CUM46409.1 unnamed protein product [Debaryomyces fabryi]